MIESLNLDNSESLLDVTNKLQINLASKFNISLDEFVNQYSDICRRFINNYISGVQSNHYTKLDWSKLESQIFVHIERHFFSGKVQDILNINN